MPYLNEIALLLLVLIFVRFVVHILGKTSQMHLAQHSWYVKQVTHHKLPSGDSDRISLVIHTADRERKIKSVYFKSTHPDFHKLNEIEKLDKIEFEFINDSKYGYLKIKEVIKYG